MKCSLRISSYIVQLDFDYIQEHNNLVKSTETSWVCYSNWQNIPHCVIKYEILPCDSQYVYVICLNGYYMPTAPNLAKYGTHGRKKRQAPPTFSEKDVNIINI